MIYGFILFLIIAYLMIGVAFVRCCEKDIEEHVERRKLRPLVRILVSVFWPVFFVLGGFFVFYDSVVSGFCKEWFDK